MRYLVDRSEQNVDIAVATAAHSCDILRDAARVVELMERDIEREHEALRLGMTSTKFVPAS